MGDLCSSCAGALCGGKDRRCHARRADWLLPRNALRPVDGRTKEGRAGQIEAVRRAEADMPLPRKTPFLYMSDLYSVPGTADEAAKKLFYHHEAQVLFEAEVAYSRGEVDAGETTYTKFTDAVTSGASYITLASDVEDLYDRIMLTGGTCTIHFNGYTIYTRSSLSVLFEMSGSASLILTTTRGGGIAGCVYEGTVQNCLVLSSTITGIAAKNLGDGLTVTPYQIIPM